MAWVSLRPSVFATNFAGMWSAQIRSGDIVGGPYADASSAPIAEADIAAVAARVLLTDDFAGQRIPLTVPQALTNAELVEVIGTVLAGGCVMSKPRSTSCGSASSASAWAPISPTRTC